MNLYQVRLEKEPNELLKYVLEVNISSFPSSYYWMLSYKLKPLLKHPTQQIRQAHIRVWEVIINQCWTILIPPSMSTADSHVEIR